MTTLISRFRRTIAAADTTASREALADAQGALECARVKSAKAAQDAARLRDLREKNHFADDLFAAMQRKPHAT